MVDFGGLADKAKDFISGHDNQVKDGIKKVGDFVGDKIGHDKVDGVESKLDGLVDKLAGNKRDAPAAPAPAAPAGAADAPAAPASATDATDAPAAPAAPDAPAAPAETPAAPAAGDAIPPSQ